jgi:cellulose biosynthesis protein BcsQ
VAAKPPTSLNAFAANLYIPPVSLDPHDLSAPVPTGKVLAVCSNKGGVGKTTVATNLAIYLRALHEDLPILIFSLDDQGIIERMFGFDGEPIGDGNVKHGWAERSLERLVHMGQYGVHFVPSAPDTALLKARAEDPETLRRILEHTEWPGLVIVDTKSDLEALTRNALHAADRVVLPVADWASLEEAAKAFTLLQRIGQAKRARVLLTLVDRRTHLEATGEELSAKLRDEMSRRGWPIYETSLSRSPRVEALNSESGRPLSVLHHARGTSVHRELRALAEEVARDLGIASARRGESGAPARPHPIRTGASAIKSSLLRGLGRSS